MKEAVRWTVVIAAAFAAGWLSHNRSADVHAQETVGLYQLQSLSVDGALSIYYPASNAIYVYQGAVVGHNILNCSFSFQLGKPGEPIKRQQCPVPTLR